MNKPFSVPIIGRNSKPQIRLKSAAGVVKLKFNDYTEVAMDVQSAISLQAALANAIAQAARLEGRRDVLHGATEIPKLPQSSS